MRSEFSLTSLLNQDKFIARLFKQYPKIEKMALHTAASLMVVHGKHGALAKH